MNGINDISGNAKWTNFINAALDASTVDGAAKLSGTGVIEGDSLVVTLKDSSGNAVKIAVDPPELDPATGLPNTKALEAMTAKIDGAVEDFMKQYTAIEQEVKASGINEHSTGTQKMLFDIYQLMTLMVELAQQQREVSRNERYAELTLQTSAIDSQVEQQKFAARLALGMSIGFSVLSIGASIGASVMSARASAKAIQMEEQVGATQAKSDFAIAQNRSLESAKTKVESLSNDLTAEQSAGVREAFKQSDATFKGPNGLEKTMTDCEAHIDAKQTALLEKAEANAARVEQLDTKYQTAKTNYENARKDYDMARKDDNVSIETQEFNKTKLQAARKEYDEAGLSLAKAEKEGKAIKTELERTAANAATIRSMKEGGGTTTLDVTDDPELAALNEKMTAAKADYELNLQSDMKALDGKLHLTQGRLEQARQAQKTNQEFEGKPVTKETIAKLESEVEDLGAEVSWGRAHVTKEYLQYDMEKAYQGNLDEMRVNLDQKTTILDTSAEYKSLKSKGDMFIALGQGATTLGQLGGQITSYVHGTNEAAATAMQKEQKTAEAAREESSNLFSSAKELLDSVLRLMSSVIQAEKDSVQAIMRV